MLTERQLGMRCPHLALLALAHAASADEAARQRGAGDDAAAPAGPVAGAADEGETAAGVPPGRYEANWDSLMTRPLPQWYDQAKVGVRPPPPLLGDPPATPS